LKGGRWRWRFSFQPATIFLPTTNKHDKWTSMTNSQRFFSWAALMMSALCVRFMWFKLNASAERKVW
jgi:hypothetical protein